MDAAALTDVAPLLRRAVGLDAKIVVRIRHREDALGVLVRLPFGVLVGRTVRVDEREDAPSSPLDVTVRADEALAWIDGNRDRPPEARDAQWRGAVPPQRGWQPVEVVPDDVVRPLVRSGALALQDAAKREGVPGAQPRAEVADALLDATVLTVDDEHGTSADVSLRALSATTRMGFLPRGGQIRVDVCGRWTRVVGEHGTVYLEQPGSGLAII